MIEGVQGALHALIVCLATWQLAQCLRKVLMGKIGGIQGVLQRLAIKCTGLHIGHQHRARGMDDGMGLARGDEQAIRRLQLPIKADRDGAMRAQDKLMGIMGVGRRAPRLTEDQAVIRPQPQLA